MRPTTVLPAAAAREPPEPEPRASDYDAVIVGARCAGAATAMLLARAGRRVLLVDRGRYGTDTLSTHALMRGAVVQLQRWHVLPAVIAAGTPPVRQATFFYGDDEPVPVPIKPRDGIDALYAPRRSLLDRLLVDAAGAAGAEVVYGLRIRDVPRSREGRVIGALLEDESGRVHRVASRMVVGADGLRSAVARLAGSRVYREGRHASGTMYGHWRGLTVSGYEWFYAPGLSAGAIPTNAGEVCVFVSVPAAEFTSLFAHRESPAATFCELLSRVAPDLSRHIGRAGPVRLQGFAGHPGFFRQAHGAGWALVGDAGYFRDPMTAHGITDALRDAELLASAIDDGSDPALAEYQAQRDAASLELFEATDAIASFRWNQDGVRALHESLARAMAREVRQLAGA